MSTRRRSGTRPGRASTGNPIGVPQLAVAASAAFSIVMNVLAVTLPLGGRETAEISRAFPTLVEPAGYVFSIWSLIYLGLIGYVVWQFLPAQRGPGPAEHVFPYVVAVNVLNGLWLLAWHHLWLATSVLIMLALLGALIGVYLGLRGGVPVPEARLPRGERIWARGTFSVYLGWITVATVANVSIYLASLGWDGSPLPASVWAAVAIALATAVGVLMLRRHHDLAFAAVLVWAFIGIVVARPSVYLVSAVAVVGILTLLYTAAVRGARPSYTAGR
jgi:translocator protein